MVLSVWALGPSVHVALAPLGSLDVRFWAQGAQGVRRQRGVQAAVALEGWQRVGARH